MDQIGRTQRLDKGLLPILDGCCVYRSVMHIGSEGRKEIGEKCKCQSPSPQGQIGRGPE